MKAWFTLIPASKKADIDLTLMQRMLPSEMRLREEGEALYLDVEGASPDEQVKYQVQRELDRLFFKTGVRYNAEMFTGRVTSVLNLRYPIFNQLPADIAPLNWSDQRALQFRLWSEASDMEDEVVRLILLYQIIELEPNPPSLQRYTDPTVPPHPLVECRLLRNLVAHVGPAEHHEVCRYCEFLGLPPVMFDRTNAHQMRTILDRAHVVQEEAARILSRY